MFWKTLQLTGELWSHRDTPTRQVLSEICSHDLGRMGACSSARGTPCYVQNIIFRSEWAKVVNIKVIALCLWLNFQVASLNLNMRTKSYNHFTNMCQCMNDNTHDMLWGDLSSSSKGFGQNTKHKVISLYLVFLMKVVSSYVG